MVEATATAAFPAIEEVRLSRFAMPLEEPIRSGIHAIDSIHLFVAEVSAGGSTGLGFAFACRPNEIAAVAAIGADLAAVVKAEPRGVRAHWQAMWDHLNFIGHEGAGVMAMAAIDTALWDLLAREAELPLYRLLGAAAPGVDVYGAGGWLSWPVERVIEEARSFAAAGYGAYKMRVGAPEWRGDVERVRAVREAIDPEMGLMVDANQAWSVDVAIQFGEALEDVGLIWIEEPTDAQDHAGQARLARTLRTPVAAGETLWARRGFTQLLAAGGVDVVQLDLMRCGGITPFMAIVPLVEATRAPVTSHLFTPISAHLLAASARPYMAEHLPSWFDPFFSRPPRIVDGVLLPTEEPGIGLELAASARERWEVRS
jgi:L-alanine-DL-glutamate epimerase-like enolase superfamily enzyme